ncbi:NAD-binding protein [Nitratiruptor sp. SB155-2]|uniref:NAD-binding protein n=1 Tax=Nitratiruptor sp. (strain SB155-2) TaxID=387092 RepID=UPI0001587045|nr:NAD-binding protein [Nitratiruptor sp. SB155-2]BAF70845.1 K+ transport system, NAD-binding component [Nitratiruptor sp. SB155-2]
MDIIIAGAGRVGFKLAQTLSVKHNIIIIDKNKDALSRLTESIDVMPIYGNIEDPDTFKALIERPYDIFIAVTDNDEANIISTLIADDVIDVKKKIIRLRNPFFAKSSIAHKIGIYEAVFPFIAAARSIKLLLDFPKANNVKNFIFTPQTLVSVLVEESDIHSIKEIESQDIVVVGIERDKKFYIPTDNEAIQQKDLLYLFGQKEEIKRLCDRLNRNAPKQIRKIAIFGAELLGLEIAKAFLEQKVELKIIEKDPELCKRASEILQNRATIINSRYVEHTIFEEENVKNADMVISTSNDDEDNIIRCLEAKEYGVKKTVAVNNDMEFYSLMHKLGIVAVRGPKMSAYYSILKKIASSAVITERHYCGGRGTIFMRKIFPNSPLIDKKIKPLQQEDILSFIIRNSVIHPLKQKTTLKALDVIVVFSKSYLEEKVKKWIYTL